MNAIERHMQEMLKVERDIKRTKSWKRKNDLMKYHKRLKRELLEYAQYRNL